MKQTTTPAIKYIDGQPFVRVIDLGHMWDTTTSNILATCKDHHVPEEYLRRIDGRVWCELAGLRYRLTATKRESRLTRHIREFLDSQARADTAATLPKQKANDNEKNFDNLTEVIHDLQVQATETNAETFAAKEKAAAAVSVSHASRNRARNNAQRLTKQATKLEALEADSYRRFDTVMTRCHRIERRQGDNAVQLTAVKQDVRFLKWTAAMFAILQVVSGILRMARHR